MRAPRDIGLWVELIACRFHEPDTWDLLRNIHNLVYLSAEDHDLTGRALDHLQLLEVPILRIEEQDPLEGRHESVSGGDVEPFLRQARSLSKRSMVAKMVTRC